MIAEDHGDGSESPHYRQALLTQRLVLRPPRHADLSDLVRLANNRGVAAMLSRMPHPYGEADGLRFLDAVSDRRSSAIYALALADTGAFIGCAALSSGPDGLSLGYWLGQAHWGQGYATEAAHALVDLGFEARGVQELHASCRVMNGASRRVLHKCGFQYAGQGMMQFLVAGQVPVERYRLDRRTWAGLRSWPSCRGAPPH